MLFAAHPDDESLGCSVVLQRAVRVGAEVRVVYVTDGENNPWPQRVLERKWRITESDRKRWGRLRRAEALAALEVLGVDTQSAFFLGLPDQGLTELLVSNPEPVIKKIARLVVAWSPTDIFVPSLQDIHPDHSALGVLLQLVTNDRSSREPKISFWSYLVHGTSPAFLRRATSIGQADLETITKLRAIGSHRTQVKLFGNRFWNHALRPERFVNLDSVRNVRSGEVNISASRDPRKLILRLERPWKLVPSPKASVFVIGYDNDSRVRCLKMDVPARTSVTQIRDVARRRNLPSGYYCGGSFSGTLDVPMRIFSPQRSLFIKVERRGWFFDESGWLELPGCVAIPPPARSRALRETLRNEGRRAVA